MGSRFWPLSTPERPKQLLPLISAAPMLRDSIDRLLPLAPLERTLVLTNASLRDAVLAMESAIPPDNVIAEPRPRVVRRSPEAGNGRDVMPPPPGAVTISQVGQG